MEFKERFIKMPESVLGKRLSLRAVFMYAKMLMLHDKVYDREVWVTNPINGKKEMSVDALSDITKRLEKAKLIRVVPTETTKSRYKTNTYELIPQSGHYKPVSYDFINNCGLSAEARGLGILMGLLKKIPSSDSAIGKAIGVSTQTVKKYIYELEHFWIFNREVKLLNEECFPYYKQVRAKRERHAKQVLDDYKDWISMFEDANNEPTPYYKRSMEWLKRLHEPEEVKAMIWRKVMTGAWQLTKEDKIQLEAEKNKPVAEIRI